MSNLTQLRLAAREIFAATLQAIDAGAAVRHAVRLDGSRLTICETPIEIGDRKIYSIAFGKAAVAMAATLEEILDQKLTSGVLSGPEVGKLPVGTTALIPRHLVFHGGHPGPNEQSLAAAQACFELLDRANQEHALVIFLVSGGGSAMLESPINSDITLSDLRAANKAIVNSGASIIEVNAVRRAFSSVKGGRLAARAQNCEQVTLIISDVPPGKEANVASGPTLPPADAPAASEVVTRYDLRSHLPEAILSAIDAQGDAQLSESTDSTLMRKHFVLLDNNSALEAAADAARGAGFVAEIARDISDQSIEAGCAELMSRLEGMREKVQEPACLISGGEFACPVKGDGIGGRNLETALRLACSTNLSWPDNQPFVALCAGTDGIDGNSPAAGAIVDHTTIERARAIGLDPEDSLRRSDAYSFFVALGDAVATGPTGTNVRDIRIMLAGA